MSKPDKPNLRIDELHLARLGIISIQTWMDTSITRTTAAFHIGPRQYRVEILAPQGRPHGIDTDVILAIQTLYHQQGRPDHGWIHTTTYELREHAGLPDNGKSHSRLKDSLQRLATCTFIAQSPGEPSAPNHPDTIRSHLEHVHYHEPDHIPDLPGLDDTATLSLKLPPPLAENLQAGFAQILDGQLLRQLEQPPARALYRLLEAHRLQRDGSRPLSLTVTLEDWRQACGINTTRPEIVRRTLHAAHDELIAVRHLQAVEWHGRGKKQTLTYHFQTEEAPDPALVELLMHVGFSRTAALSIAQVHEHRVEAAVAFARQRQASGYQIKNLPGFIADYLKSPDKYTPSPETTTDPSTEHTPQDTDENPYKPFEQPNP